MVVKIVIGVKINFQARTMKNFGLYGERVGTLSIVAHSQEAAKRVGTHVKKLIRSSYSNPPRFGASIVATILQSPEIKEGWKRELQTMRGRIQEMREALAFGLMSEGTNVDFNFLNEQKGLFSFSGLNEQQVDRLRNERGIYMIGNGRMNVAGLNPTNIEYVIESILSVLKK